MLLCKLFKSFFSRVFITSFLNLSPSFFQSIPNVFETKIDNLIGSPRTEYHCKKCGGHHGHIFDDGPLPTGKRYCNNGICLVFKPKA